MPPIRPVPTLQDSSLKHLGKLLITLLKRRHQRSHGFEPVVIYGQGTSNIWLQTLTKYFQENLIIPLRNRLLSHVVYQVLHTKYDGAIDLFKEGDCNQGRYRVVYSEIRNILSDVLWILGGETVTSIDLCHERLFKNIETKCKEALMLTVFQNHKWAENLQSLSLKYLSDFDPISLCHIIRTVGENCHNLEHLDVESLEEPSRHLNDMIDSLRWLYGNYTSNDTPKGCPKLKTLILPKFKALPAVVDHALKMLYYMPGLCALQNIDTRTVVEKYMREMALLKPLNLVELEEWKTMYTGNLEHLSQVLPHLRTYKSYLGGLMDPQFLKLNILSSHFSLTTLVLYFNSESTLDIDFKNIPTMTNVECLTIDVDQEDIHFSQVECFSKTFPNVSKLRIQSSGLFEYLDFEEENLDFEDKNHNTFFQNLKSLELCRILEIDVGFLNNFLDRCPNLISLNLLFTYDFEETPAEPPFREIINKIGEKGRNLEKISLVRENPELLMLDKEDALSLMLHCPKLTWLGRLSTWLVSEKHVEELLKMSKSNNWDIHISYSQMDIDEAY